MGRYDDIWESRGSANDDTLRSESREHDDERHIHSRRHPSRSFSPRPRAERNRRHYLSNGTSRSPRRRSLERCRHQNYRSSRSRSPPPKRRRREDSPRHSRYQSKSPSPRHRNYHRSQRSPSPHRRSITQSKRSTQPLPSQSAAYSKEVAPTSSSLPEKQKPNYGVSGLLAAETNTVANTSVVLKYNEPPESQLPPTSQPWRLYIFKSSDLLETLNLYERTHWLFGRETQVVDHATEHPSCSKQHAVLQFRYTEKKDEWGQRKGKVRLYLIDLESANGSFINGEQVPEKRFVEVKTGDVIKFGDSTREYVALLPPKE